MPLIRFRGTGNTTIPVSSDDPLPVAVVSGGGGGGGGPASDVTIVGVQSGVVFNTAIGSVASGVTVPIALNSVGTGVTVPIALNSVGTGVTVPIALNSVGTGVTVPIALNSVASGVTVPIALNSVASGVTVPVAGRVGMATLAQSATFQSQNASADITVSGTNLHDFGGCIIHYHISANTYTVRLHGSFTAGGNNAPEMVVAEATNITGRGFLVLPTLHVPILRVEFVRTGGNTSGQTNRVFIVLTPSMPV